MSGTKTAVSFALSLCVIVAGCRKDRPPPSEGDEQAPARTQPTSSGPAPAQARTRPAPAPRTRPATAPTAADEQFERKFKQVLSLEADTKFYEAMALCQQMQGTFASHPKAAGLAKVISRLRGQRLRVGGLPEAIRDLVSGERIIVKMAVTKLAAAGPVGRIFLRKAVRANPDEQIAAKAGEILIEAEDPKTVHAAFARLAADRAAGRTLVSALLIGVVEKALLNERLAPKQVDPELPPAMYRLVMETGGEIKWKLVRALGLFLRRGCGGDIKKFDAAVRNPSGNRHLVVLTAKGLLSKDPKVVGWACDHARYFCPMVPGLHGKYFADKTFKKLAIELLDKTATRDTARTFPFPDNRQDDISIRWTGYLRVTKPGDHVFSLHADDKAWLYVDDKLVLTRAGWAESKATVKLDPGLHKFRVDYVQARDNSGIRLTWAEPNIPQTNRLPVVTKPWRRLVLKMGPAIDDLVAAKRDLARAARARLASAGELGRIYLRDALVTKPDKVAEKALEMLVPRRDKPTAAILISLLAKKPKPSIAGALTDGLRTLADLIDPNQYAPLYRRVKQAPAEMTPQAAALCGVLEKVCDANAARFNALVGDPKAYADLNAHVAGALTSKDPAAAGRASRFGAPFAPRMRGLRGQYFNGWQFDQRVMQRLDSQVFVINRQFPMPKGQQDDIAARWTGMVAAPADGNYTFYVQASRSARLWIDDRQVAVSVGWQLRQSVVKLGRGLHRLKIDYTNPTGSDQIQLHWSGPGLKKQRLTSSALRTAPWPAESANIAAAIKKLASEKPGELLAARAKLRQTWPASGTQLRNTIRYGDGKVFVESARFLTDQRDEKTPSVLIARLRAAPAPAPDVADAIALGLTAMAGKIDPARLPEFLKAVRADTARAMIPQASVLCGALDRLCANDAKKFARLVKDLAAYDALKAYVAAALTSKDSAGVVRACQYGYPFAPLLAGMRGRYYDGSNRDSLVRERIDWRISFPNRQFPHPAGRQDNVSARWTGLLKIDRPGKYTFFARGETRTKVRLDDRLIVEATTWGEKQGAVDLAPGLHRFRVDYRQVQGAGTTRAEVSWTGPGISKQVLSGSALGTPAWPALVKHTVDAVGKLASAQPPEALAARAAVADAQPVATIPLRNALRYAGDAVAAQAAIILARNHDAESAGLVAGRFLRATRPADIRAFAGATGGLARWLAREHVAALYRKFNPQAATPNLPAAVLAATLDRACGGDKARFNALAGNANAYDRLRAYFLSKMTDKDPAVVAWACEHAGPFAPPAKGLWGSYYLGRNFDTLKAGGHAATIAVANRSFAPLCSREDNISARWTGKVLVAKPGKYTFYVTADDGARVWVDDRLVADAWRFAAGREAQGVVHLAAGPHTLDVNYYQRLLTSGITLSWSGPGIGKQVIPETALRTAPRASELAKLSAVIKTLASANAAQVTAARKRLTDAGEPAMVLLRNALRHDSGPVLPAAAVLLDTLGDKQALPLLMARLKKQPAAPVAADICGALARMPTKIAARDASWLHRRVKADTNFKATHYADLLLAVLEKACKGAPARFNALVADPKGLDALKAYVEKAAASKNAPLAKWAAGKFNLLKIVKKP